MQTTDHPAGSGPRGDWPRRAVRAVTSQLGNRLASHEVSSDLVQIAKTSLAAVAAWLLASHVFGLAQGFLAPWTALLTVHATVHRTLSRGAQTVGATVLGVGLAWAAARLVGVDTWSIALALVIGLLLSRLALWREEGVTVATTALFVLTTATASDGVMLVARLADVVLGVLVGVTVNVLVFPPLHDQLARQTIDTINAEMGRLMLEMADELGQAWTEERSGAWIERTRDIDDRVDRGWQLVWHARESGWWNPRRRRHRAAEGPSYEEVLGRLEDGVAELRSIARTIDESTRSSDDWDPDFRGPWVRLLREAGTRVGDPEGEVASLRGELDQLARHLSREDLPGLLWPVYGALLTNLRNVIRIVDDTASRRPVRA